MAYDFAGLKILVVDDSQYMRTIFREFLSALGLKRRNILECANGEEALEALHAFKPHLVITDYLMQPVDGLELTHRIRQDDDPMTTFLPIILCTGYTEPDRVEEARDAGVHEVLAKPITATTLYRRIQSIIENPRQFERCKEYFGPDRRRRHDEVDDLKRISDDVLSIEDDDTQPDAAA